MAFIRFAFLCFILLGSFSFCQANFLFSDTTKSKLNTEKKIIIPQHTFSKTLSKDCEKIEAVSIVISEAIEVGAPTYNDGNHIGCYRIYEGAAYKILFKYGSKCKNVKNILETALEKSYGDYTASQKAWIMRLAFDQILGVPTTTK